VIAGRKKAANLVLKLKQLERLCSAEMKAPDSGCRTGHDAAHGPMKAAGLTKF
jgi:hypothetical protein